MESDEEEQRRNGCDLIQKAVLLLKLPQVAAVTAQVLFHRFYFRRSFQAYDYKSIAVTTLFLASKLEDCANVKLRDYLIAFHFLENKRSHYMPPKLDVGSSEYWDRKRQLLATERVILTTLGFQVEVEAPHKYILSYLRVLGYERNERFAQLAWNYCNDILRCSDSCVFYTSQVIAASAIYLAARKANISLPEAIPDDDDGEEDEEGNLTAWWDIFEVDKEDIIEVAYDVMRLYAQAASMSSDSDNTSSATEQQLTPVYSPASSRDDGSSPATTPRPVSTPSPRSDRGPSVDRSPASASSTTASTGAGTLQSASNEATDRQRGSRDRSRDRDSSREKDADRERDRSRERDRDYDRRRDRDRSRYSERERDRYRDSDRHRDRDRDRDRNRGRDHDRYRDRTPPLKRQREDESG